MPEVFLTKYLGRLSFGPGYDLKRIGELHELQRALTAISLCLSQKASFGGGGRGGGGGGGGLVLVSSLSRSYPLLLQIIFAFFVSKFGKPVELMISFNLNFEFSDHDLFGVNVKATCTLLSSNAKLLCLSH